MNYILDYGSDSDTSENGNDQKDIGGVSNDCSKAPRQHAIADVDSSDTEFFGSTKEESEDSDEEDNGMEKNGEDETEELLNDISKDCLSMDIQSTTGASTPGGASVYSPRPLLAEEEAALLEADENQFNEQEQSKVNVQLPASPPGECSPSLIQKFTEFFERKEQGWDMKAVIKRRRDFNNPSLYEDLINIYGIDENGTNFKTEVFDPKKFRSEDFFEELCDRQPRQVLKRKH